MQETQTVKLNQSGATIITKGYVTGYVDQEVQKIRLGANKTHYEAPMNSENANGELPKDTKIVMDIDPTIQLEADNKLLELMVISVNGSSDNVLEAILNLPKDDVLELLDAIKSIETMSKVEGADPKVPQS